MNEMKGRMLRLCSLLEEAQADAEARHRARLNGQPLGPLTRLRKLDEALGGAVSPGLHILHGSPGAGKTAFALQTARTCGCPALYVTCEMAPLELLRRITAAVTGEYLGRLKSGEKTPEEMMRLYRQAAEAAPMLAIADAAIGTVGVEDLQTFADLTRRQAPDSPHLLLVVDSVHAWARATVGNAPVTEYEALNAALSALGETARRLNCAIIGIGERNRASMGAGGQSASAGTRVFEYSSESVLSLQREKDVQPDRDGYIPVSLIVEKNRHGAHGMSLQLRFHGATQRFEEDFA